MPAAPQLILFDAVGTLLRPEPSVAEAYAAAAARYGIKVPVDEVQRRFQAAFARQEQVDYQLPTGRTDAARERQRWREIVAEVFPEAASSDGAQRGSADDLFDDLWGHFADAKNWRLYDDAREVLSLLMEQGQAVGIASNFDQRLLPLCRQVSPLERCRYVFASAELGWRKPHAEFFAAIERQVRLSGQQIMLVGDDLENDYLAARAAGWRAVLVNRCGKHASIDNRVSDLRLLHERIRQSRDC